MRSSERRADAAARDAVIDPELADLLVLVRQGEVVCRAGMGEERGVEVEADPSRPRPLHPTLEVLRPDLMAIDALSAELPVEGVQVEAMLARDTVERLLGIAAKLIRRACLARVTAGRRQTAAELPRSARFKPPDVVALPAMQGDRHARQPLQRGLGVDAQLCIPVFGRVVRQIHRANRHPIHSSRLTRPSMRYS